MIDLIPSEQVEELIEQRKQEFKLDSNFLVLTPLNHAFYFFADGNVNICDSFDGYMFSSYQPEIVKLYGVEYDGSNVYIDNSKTHKHLYNLFINNPECMFFFVHEWIEIEQELKNRGLI